MWPCTYPYGKHCPSNGQFPLPDGRKATSLLAHRGTRRPFERNQVGHSIPPRMAAHLLRGPQSAAHRRALRPAEQPTAIIVRKLHAAHTRRLPIRHARNRRRNRRRDTTRATTNPAFHMPSLSQYFVMTISVYTYY